MQVEDDILLRMEQGGKVEIVYGGNIEFIRVNFSDPNTEVDGEWSVRSRAPVARRPAVRQALNLLVDRSGVQEQIYSRGADQRLPERAVEVPVRQHEVGVQHRQANALLEQAGWKRAPTAFTRRTGNA
jgi:peptide/nickel transport system substrate-binding protein